MVDGCHNSPVQEYLEMCVAFFQPLQIYHVVTQLQFFTNIELKCCQWSRLLVCWNSYRQYLRLDILLSVDSCYWQRRFAALQVKCRYGWLIKEWNWESYVTHCQYAQDVVFIHQFETHFRESSLCDVCCFCCCSIWGTCCSIWGTCCRLRLKSKPSRNVNCVCDYVCKTNNATGVVASNWRMSVYLLEFRFDYDSRSAKLFVENVPGLIICLWGEIQTRNCSFCMTREANLQVLQSPSRFWCTMVVWFWLSVDLLRELCLVLWLLCLFGNTDGPCCWSVVLGRRVNFWGSWPFPPRWESQELV